MASQRTQVVLAYLGFVLVGVSAGVGGVLLPAQVADYEVDLSTIGLTFVTFSVGFFLAGTSTGWLMARLGTAGALGTGAVGFLIGAFVTAARPSFVGLVVLQLVAGYGMGLLESVLNAHIAAMPDATTLLNRLHAFFGAGAFVGPLLATRLLVSWDWPAVWLALGLAGAPLLVAQAWLFPRRTPAGAGSAAAHAPADGPAEAPADASLSRPLRAVAREPAVLLAALFLTVYVGLEISLGNWGFTYLVEHDGHTRYAAGATMSGYWLGLTAGRFVISPLATRLGLGTRRMVDVCLAGVVGAGLLAWVAPQPLVTSAGLVLLGFFLGPLFPTAMAVAPRLTEPHRAPAAIGLMNALSVVGGAGLPWLAGALAQGVGIGTLLPYALVLAVVQGVVWRLVAQRMAPAPVHVSQAGI